MKGGEAREREIDNVIGERIRERRKSLNMSQTELGRRLGISFQQLQKMEKGTNRIPAGRLVVIAAELQTPIGYFFDGIVVHIGTGDIAAPSAAACRLGAIFDNMAENIQGPFLRFAESLPHG